MTTTRTAYLTTTVARAARLGLVPAVVDADQLHAKLPADGTPVKFFERIGLVKGQEMYGLTRVKATARGVEFILTDGRTISVHPLGEGRTIRTLI